MRLRYIAFTALIVVLALGLTCCNGGGDTATMRELAGIDSLLSKARQYELAQHRLDSLHPSIPTGSTRLSTPTIACCSPNRTTRTISTTRPMP